MATQEIRVGQLAMHAARLRHMIGGLIQQEDVDNLANAIQPQFDEIAISITSKQEGMVAVNVLLNTVQDTSMAPTAFSVSGDGFSVNHNLGYQPLVTLLDASDIDVTDGTPVITHTTINQVSVSGAGGGFSGTLIVS